MRRAAAKDRNASVIIDALRKFGCSVSILSGEGIPDLVVGLRGRNYLLEVKDPEQPPSARKLKPAQVKWHRTWRGQAAVVLTVEEALRACGLDTVVLHGITFAGPKEET